MNKILSIFLVSLAIFHNTSIGIDCYQIPKTYLNYEEVFKSVKAVNFKINKTVNYLQLNVGGGTDVVIKLRYLKTEKCIFFFTQYFRDRLQ